jgi:hypothetical protein
VTSFSCNAALGPNGGLAKIRTYILQQDISVFSIHDGVKLRLKWNLMGTSGHSKLRHIGSSLNINVLQRAGVLSRGTERPLIPPNTLRSACSN